MYDKLLSKMIQCVYGFDIRSCGGWIVTENMMEKVDLMTKNSRACRLTRLMLAMVVGIFVSMFSFGTVTVQAADTAVENVVEEQVPQDGSVEDNGGGAMILLMGGMLIIILAVVLSVVGTFVSSAAIADEL